MSVSSLSTRFGWPVPPCQEVLPRQIRRLAAAWRTRPTPVIAPGWTDRPAEDATSDVAAGWIAVSVCAVLAFCLL